MEADPAALLRDHVARFNEAVRSGDFAPMLTAFTDDSEMRFEGVPAGPFVGRDAIAEAYAENPPDDEIRLLGPLRVHGDGASAAYAWARDGMPAGRIALT